MKLGLSKRECNSRLLLLLLLSMMAITILLTVDGADGATIVVPDDFETITDAVEAASDGDTIRVYDGVYQETVEISKSISLIGNGTDRTMMSGTERILVLQTDGITVSGMRLAGENFTIPIEFKDAGNCLVRNMVLTGSSSGIFMTGSDNNRIINCSLDGFTSGLTIFSDSDGNLVENVTFSSCDYGAGITGYHTEEPVGNSFQGCTFVDNRIGLWVGASGVNTSFYNCTFKGNRAGMDFDRGKYATFIDCTFQDNSWMGMRISRFADWALIERCTFTNNIGFGLVLDLVGNVTVKDVTCIDNGVGIYLGTAYDTLITGGEFRDNGKGLWLQSGAANNRIEDVSCINNSEYGVFINRSHSNSLKDSTLDGNGNGLHITGGSHDIQITDCTMRRNKDNGLGISASRSITIYGCYLSYNEEVGIHVKDGSNKVTIDGCSLIANGRSWHAEWDSGILFEDTNQSTIRNVMCFRNVVGIWLVRSSHNWILDSNLSSSDGDGILVSRGSDNNHIEGLTCIANSWNGISLADSDGNIVMDCTIIGVFRGISLYSGSNDTIIRNCQISEPYRDCLFIDSSSSVWVFDCTMTGSESGSGILIDGYNSDLRFERCSISDNYYAGIRVGFDDHCDAVDVSIVDNIIFNNTNFGVHLTNFNQSQLSDNIIRDNGHMGVFVWGSNGLLIANNTISGNLRGGALGSCDRVVFEHNLVENNSLVGINLTYWGIASDYWLHNNSFKGNGFGQDNGTAISYWGTEGGYTLVENNTLEGNNGGISVGSIWSWRQGNVIRFNTIRDCAGVALACSRNDTGNLVHFNFLINNSAYGRSPSSEDDFDDGALGNYWDDYQRRYPKARRIGQVWDTPYEVEPGSGVYDHYPLAFIWDPKPLDIDLGPDFQATVKERVILTVRTKTPLAEITRYSWTIIRASGVMETKDPGLYHYELLLGSIGRATVRVTVYDIYGNVATDTVNIIIVDDVRPVADAGHDIRAHLGEMFTLDGSDSKDNYGLGNMSWIVDPDGMGLAHEGPIFTLSLSVLGEFRAILTVFDAEGNRDDDWIYLRIFDETQPIVDAGADIVTGQNELVHFNGRGSTDDHGISDWNWSFGHAGEVIFLRGPEPIFSFEMVGTYIVTLKASDASGNWGLDDVTVTVTDTTPPVPVVVNAIVVDMGEFITLDASLSHDNVGIAIYEWTLFDDDHWKWLHGAQTLYIFSESGSYVINLNVSDEVGNWATRDLKVTVRDTQAPTAMIFIEGTADVGVPFSLNGTGSRDNVGIIFSHWTFEHRDGPMNISGLAAVFTFEEPGEYEVTLTVRDARGNQDTDTATIRVLPPEPTVEGHSPWPWVLLFAMFIVVLTGAWYLRRKE